MRNPTHHERRQVRQLVHQCANYDRPMRLCLLLDMVDNPGDCPMLATTNTGKVCGYFRKAVLPLHPMLEAALTHSAPVAKRVCIICQQDYVPVGNRQQYCSDKCRVKAKRAHDREWRRKQRDVPG